MKEDISETCLKKFDLFTKLFDQMGQTTFFIMRLKICGKSAWRVIEWCFMVKMKDERYEKRAEEEVEVYYEKIDRRQSFL